MKANELRIGNLVYINGILEKIDLDSFHGIATYDCLDSYNPIPLTEEWLVKFGFYKSNKLFYSIQAGNFFEISVCIKKGPSGCFGSVAFESLEYDKGLGHMLGKCEHVHQLQNLYFALTGQELEIK